MLAIKLKMVGRRGQHSFRVIVQEARSKLRGKFVEDLGWYNPHLDKFELKDDRVLYWLKVGAQPTETVSQLIKKSKLAVEDIKIQVGPRTDSTEESGSKEMI